MPDTLLPPAAALEAVAGAWYGPAVAGLADWRHTLGAAEIAEIEAALAGVRGRPILEIGAADFPLPTLAPRLAAIRREALHGCGFFLLRGLPIARYDIADAARIFWGLGAHWGEPVSQNGKGHVLGHVKDLGLNYNDPMARGYQTAARLPYHTDSSDLVCLLCLKKSKAGGLSSLVSTTTVYNEMVRRRPDLAAVLMQPLYRTRWGEVPEGRKPYYGMPAFSLVDGRVICTYVRSAVRKAQLMDVVPRLSAEQVEAMDLFDELANDPALHLDMTFEPGDIQVVCNHSIAHSRTAYEDFAEPEQRRHLLRLWLACADGPTLPAAFTGEHQGMTKSGRPDGIKVPGVDLVAPLRAED
ncbi:MAG: TauD/TfdA family dioxygenase [Alphaproteobacteria bacterium]|nr:TauD/TfdA family dioxygenase [Alphaproteobacteria bacterium]MCB9929100.1 TauD/TfdA family dioxygenase [Alphaproteobacteria bacterium]